LQKPLENFSQTREYDWELDVEFDKSKLVDLDPNRSISIPIIIAGVAQSGTPGHDKGLQPDEFEVALGKLMPRSKSVFYTAFVPIQILVAGTATDQALDKFLASYEIDGQSIEAGFVPAGSRLVDGEDLILTFVVRNRSEQPYVFSFGGDYRGVHRHNRFKIEVRDEQGKLLPDPGAELGDFGGIVYPRVILAGRTTTETLDLAKYRSIAGPGKYTIKASFELADEFGWSGRDGKRSSQRVESQFTLSILPRTDENVANVVNRLLQRCRQSSGVSLERTVATISKFGRSAAVPGLAELARRGPIAVRRAATRGLGAIDNASALEVLLSLERDDQLRVVALRALGSFSDPRAVERAVEALGDENLDIRVAGIESLGNMKSDSATAALLQKFELTESPNEQCRLLAALAARASKQAFATVATALTHPIGKVRRAAVDAIIHFDSDQATEELRKYVEDDDLDFREYVIRNLAEKLRQPIAAAWLAPVIRSRNGKNSIGDAPRLLRLYCGEEAAPTLLSTLDFQNPSIRNYYNMTIIQNQLACRTGLALPWNADLNRDGSPEELAENRDALDRIKYWLDEYQQRPWPDPPEPWRLPPEQEQATWGEEVDGVKLRARTNTMVWPDGLPQVLIIELISDGGTITLNDPPQILEIEVDGRWYTQDPDAETEVAGEWHAYKGHRYHSYQLTDAWKGIDDGRALQLEVGEHTARIRVTPPESNDRTKMVTSKPVVFRIVGKQ
jgi:HEAT repeat protein